VKQPLSDERRRCEIRYVCSLDDRADRFLAEVERKRGKETADRLRAEASEQYRKGNRGEAGDWRE
jgi:hypothetical protein